jgi:four helix bundle protein
MKSFKDLKVWQEASKLSRDISTKLVPTFPKAEKYRLGNQVIRSSRSVPAQIAEGFRKSSLKEKNHYYEMALTSNEETENHLEEAKNNKFIDKKVYKHYLNRIIRVRILLARLIKSVNRIRKNNDSKTAHPR